MHGFVYMHDYMMPDIISDILDPCPKLEKTAITKMQTAINLVHDLL